MLFESIPPVGCVTSFGSWQTRPSWVRVSLPGFLLILRGPEEMPIPECHVMNLIDLGICHPMHVGEELSHHSTGPGVSSTEGEDAKGR